MLIPVPGVVSLPCYKGWMNTSTPKPTPTPTLQELQHIRHEVKAAGAELGEMLDMGGDIRRIWDEPRKYFVPEIGTCLPFPNGHLWRLVEPVWQIPEPTDPIHRALLVDITPGIQWWAIARREIISKRFTRL
jgi:hypothetical protein